MARLEHPTLYGQGPLLFGARCGRCGQISFPRQSYGCEACGAPGENMIAIEIEARGELLSFARVHKHMGSDIEAPFVMAEIGLAAGPVIRATLTDNFEEKALAAGQKVTGVLVRNPKQNADVLELRFAPDGR